MSIKYQYRFYRHWVDTDGLKSARILDRETDILVLTNKSADRDFLTARVRQYRWDIENYISKDRRFLTALKPIEVELHAPTIIQKMSSAAKSVNVGPMAAVAGAIAASLGDDLLKEGFKEVIIENGGDIFLASRKTRTVGIYAGKVKQWQRLALKIRPKMAPLSICTSSGTVGHSLSFGSADAVVILSNDGALADAAATAVANRINCKEDLPQAIAFSRSIKHITGSLIIFKNNLASWGNIELAKLISRR